MRAAAQIRRAADWRFKEIGNDARLTGMAFFELRQYRILPGKMDEWIDVMEREIIPFQISRGMVVTASYRGETDDSAYVWIRRFESEPERERLYEAVYGSDVWKNDIGPRIPEYLDREGTVVTRLVPTSRSPMQ